MLQVSCGNVMSLHMGRHGRTTVPHDSLFLCIGVAILDDDERSPPEIKTWISCVPGITAIIHNFYTFHVRFFLGVALQFLSQPIREVCNKIIKICVSHWPVAECIPLHENDSIGVAHTRSVFTFIAEQWDTLFVTHIDLTTQRKKKMIFIFAPFDFRVVC